MYPYPLFCQIVEEKIDRESPSRTKTSKGSTLILSSLTLEGVRSRDFPVNKVPCDLHIPLPIPRSANVDILYQSILVSSNGMDMRKLDSQSTTFHPSFMP